MSSDNIEPVTPNLSIEMHVNCPECDHYFDLVDTDLQEEGWLLDQVLPDSAWIEAHENFECTAVCPECSVEFSCKGVEW